MSKQRKYFADEILKQMEVNEDIYLICLDLGYGIFEKHFKKFPNRCIKTGAGEQGGIGLAIGLALSDKIPFVYSITPFLLYRPLEWIRNYLHQEKIKVNLVGSGRDTEYTQDGFSHWCLEAKEVLNALPNIKQFWPEDEKEISYMVNKMINNDKSNFISLRR